MRLFAAVALVNAMSTIQYVIHMEDDSRVQATAFGKKRGGGGVLILSGRVYIKSRSHTFSTPMQKLHLHGRDARDDGGTIRTFCVNCTVLVKRLGYNTNLFASTFTFCDTSGRGWEELYFWRY